MNPNPPILIAGPARCGTTMTAGLLYHHGVWIGEAKVTKAVHTNSLLGTENIHIKSYLKRISGKDPTPNFREEILELVPDYGPWLIKTAQTLIKWKKFATHFPHARWVLPWRPTEEIVQSSMRHPAMQRHGEEKRRQIARWHQKLQKDVADSGVNCHWVNVGDLAQRNMHEASTLLRFCGLELDEKLWAAWIDPSMWHGGSNEEKMGCPR